MITPGCGAELIVALVTLAQGFAGCVVAKPYTGVYRVENASGARFSAQRLRFLASLAS